MGRIVGIEPLGVSRLLGEDWTSSREPAVSLTLDSSSDIAHRNLVRREAASENTSSFICEFEDLALGVIPEIDEGGRLVRIEFPEASASL